MAKKPINKIKKPASKPQSKSAKKPASKASKPVAKKASKPIGKKAPAPKKPIAKAVKKAEIKPAKKAEIKKPVNAKVTAPVKTAVAPKAETKPIAVITKPIPAAKEPKAPPPPPIDTSKLPKLPKGIVLRKQKGKLAPGEKRLVKTNVITHHVVTDKPMEMLKKQKPEPEGKFVMEYLMHTPVSLLYDFLSTPNGLAEWFADGVDLKNDTYYFDWDGLKQEAKIISAKLDNFLRLAWTDKPEGTYFEFKIDQDELTNEILLTVTDFGDGPDDIATSRNLWENQIKRLMKALGSY
jgi:uncharacterized protein YndB with AHSA1/START domain